MSKRQPLLNCIFGCAGTRGARVCSVIVALTRRVCAIDACTHRAAASLTGRPCRAAPSGFEYSGQYRDSRVADSELQEESVPPRSPPQRGRTERARGMQTLPNQGDAGAQSGMNRALNQRRLARIRTRVYVDDDDASCGVLAATDSTHALRLTLTGDGEDLRPALFCWSYGARSAAVQLAVLRRAHSPQRPTTPRRRCPATRNCPAQPPVPSLQPFALAPLLRLPEATPPVRVAAKDLWSTRHVAIAVIRRPGCILCRAEALKCVCAAPHRA